MVTTKESVAEKLLRGFQIELSDEMVQQLQIERDPSLFATIVRGVRQDFARVVWVTANGEAPQGRWDAFRHALPKWTWRVLGKPAYQPLVTNLYHACPHLAGDPQSTHLRWLSQDTAVELGKKKP